MQLTNCLPLEKTTLYTASDLAVQDDLCPPNEVQEMVTVGHSVNAAMHIPVACLMSSYAVC